MGKVVVGKSDDVELKKDGSDPNYTCKAQSRLVPLH